MADLTTIELQIKQLEIDQTLVQYHVDSVLCSNSYHRHRAYRNLQAYRNRVLNYATPEQMRTINLLIDVLNRPAYTLIACSIIRRYINARTTARRSSLIQLAYTAIRELTCNLACSIKYYDFARTLLTGFTEAGNKSRYYKSVKNSMLYWEQSITDYQTNTYAVLKAKIDEAKREQFIQYCVKLVEE